MWFKCSVVVGQTEDGNPEMQSLLTCNSEGPDIRGGGYGGKVTQPTTAGHCCEDGEHKVYKYRAQLCLRKPFQAHHPLTTPTYYEFLRFKAALFVAKFVQKKLPC